MPYTAEHAIAQEIDRCITECLNCHVTCAQTAQHVMEREGKRAAEHHIRVLVDCAAMCHASAGFLLRGSPLHVRTCAVCAEACRECERVCRGATGDPVIQQCADACARCAASCEQMATPAA